MSSNNAPSLSLPQEEIDIEQRVALLAIEFIDASERIPQDPAYVALLYRDLKHWTDALKQWYRESA